MFYHDTIYGSVSIEEPVLRALMQATAVQRLKGVLQHGISGLIGITGQVTRYDHSMGVMLLVRRLGGSVDEQIAALLHDVSHTAFSHVIDYVFDDHDGQSYHEEVKEAYMLRTDLPSILARFGYDWTRFLDESAFSLLEQPSPRLCADRVDYFLRDSVGLGLADTAQIAWALDHLTVVNGRIAVADLEAARWMADTFMQADDRSWANFFEVGIYELTARAIRRGLAVGAIDEEDFWDVDTAVWQKLHDHHDAALQRQLALVSPQTQIVWDEENPDFWVSTKIRTIDPDVVVNGELRPLSAVDAAFAMRREAYLARKNGKWPMRVAALK